jgi:hypothetical protein
VWNKKVVESFRLEEGFLASVFGNVEVFFGVELMD